MSKKQLYCLHVGGYNFEYRVTELDSILSFNISSSEWVRIGNIAPGRHGHAVSAVTEEEVLQFCQ